MKKIVSRYSFEYRGGLWLVGITSSGRTVVADANGFELFELSGSRNQVGVSEAVDVYKKGFEHGVALAESNARSEAE